MIEQSLLQECISGERERLVDMQPSKIAVLRALQLGDLLLAVPALRAIRAEFPHAEITLIGLPWAASFVRRFARYIDRFVEFTGYPGIAEVPFNPEHSQQFLAEQHAYAYDLVLQMHGSGRISNQLALALGGKVTAGYYEQTLPDGLTLGMPYPDDEPEVLRNLGLAKLLGCHYLAPTLEFPLFNEDYAEASRLLGRLELLHNGGDVTVHGSGTLSGGQITRKGYPDGAYTERFSECVGTGGGCGEEAGALCLSWWRCTPRPGQAQGPLSPQPGPLSLRTPSPLAQKPPRVNLEGRVLIGIHTGARPPARRWPAEYFAQVADFCARRFNAHIVLTGSPDEMSTAHEVMKRMSVEPLNLVGQTSLGGLAALISELALFISNDTGPAHIANAVQTPSVTIFGPVDPRRWAALDQTFHPIVRHPVACSPCGYWQCPIDQRCLRWIRPEMVLHAIENVMNCSS